MTELAEFQHTMDVVYGERDRARGVPATVAWLAEEVGELAKAARKGTVDEQLHELGDVLAWLASLANQLGLSLEDAAARYRSGCPRCGASAVRVSVSLLVAVGLLPFAGRANLSEALPAKAAGCAPRAGEESTPDSRGGPCPHRQAPPARPGAKRGATGVAPQWDVTEVSSG